jgi:hypothetical protein
MASVPWAKADSRSSKKDGRLAAAVGGFPERELTGGVADGGGWRGWELRRGVGGGELVGPLAVLEERLSVFCTWTRPGLTGGVRQLPELSDCLD